jgi:hypothetical protein
MHWFGLLLHDTPVPLSRSLRRILCRQASCKQTLPEVATSAKRRLQHYQRGKKMRGKGEGRGGVVVEGQPGLCWERGTPDLSWSCSQRGQHSWGKEAVYTVVVVLEWSSRLHLLSTNMTWVYCVKALPLVQFISISWKKWLFALTKVTTSSIIAGGLGTTLSLGPKTTLTSL